MTPLQTELCFPSAYHCARAGQRLGKHLCAGDVLALSGPLGVGKTVFAKGVALGAGVPHATREVASASFILQNAHQGRLEFQHWDWYRIGAVDELNEVGWGAACASEAALFVEWADLYPEAVPEDSLWIELSYVESNEKGNHARRAVARATGPRSARLLKEWSEHESTGI
ncbi:MAG: tRNA (adenosine(37)-N6)-threonylcarbamoyltransferase complex ATPase subunit type 1 TsaE [Candidatus Omnitrophica bacterium]|nr:tRNA (adenosine(37)-N6)-threonylcarbamoyltransferase complex ATPase subunit type 1 TsaE [Candidatus Omnitrophota bacterium]